jgi:DNA-binding SARP family transcriptional activator
MDVFWPEADKKQASMSLRAAKYELRKVLRNYGVAVDEDSLFFSEKRDDLGVCSGNMLVVDIDIFLGCFHELKMLPATKNNMQKKKTILEQMMDLYQGDLLEEELYEDWTFAEREELRSIYLESALGLA